MVTEVSSAALLGVEPYKITVEAEVERGIPRFDIVGLAHHSVREGKNRILSALRSCGVRWPPKKVTVNLAPASIPKEGASLDLPIALSLLAALGILSTKSFEGRIVLGELGLDGKLRPMKGAMAFAYLAYRLSMKGLIVPPETTFEAALVPQVDILTAPSLYELIRILRGEVSVTMPTTEASPRAVEEEGDWSDVRGQLLAKRVLEISAAGEHNVLLAGPPGIGKTLLVRRLSTILPRITEDAAREVACIHSAAGADPAVVLSGVPPFRAPHHHASLAGMIGGGRPFRAGEMTLAHKGVLFLDEFPEFRRDVVEALREPLESGVVSVARTEGCFRLPAAFHLVAAMNMCPCGALGDDRKECRCTPPALARFRGRISAPIKDRMDLFAELGRPNWEELAEAEPGETSVTVRKRVERARSFQAARNPRGSTINSRLSHREIWELAAVDSDVRRLARSAVETLGLSVRALDRVLRVTRTIADLEESPQVRAPHLAEALQFRAISVAL